MRLSGSQTGQNEFPAAIQLSAHFLFIFEAFCTYFLRLFAYSTRDLQTK